MESDGLSIGGTSLQNRIAILLESGLRQLSVNPLFGDLGVDHVVGNPGGYIHSIFSVQSHLGLVGSILLFCYLAERLLTLYRSKGNAVLKVTAIPVMLMAVMATFFTWMPLWFLIGALYTVRRQPH